MNKKGEGEGLLPEETLKIIIAAICIAGLIVLLVLIYFSVTGNQNAKKAQAVISNFANETKRINLGGGRDNPSFFVPNPSGWYIFSFVGEDIKPNSCAGANCLCVCEKISIEIFNVEKRQAERCDDEGVCTVVVNLKKFNPTKIENGGIFVSINKINGSIEITK